MSRQRPRTESELVEFVRSIDVAAPEALHRSVEAMIAERARRRAPTGARRFPALPRLVAGAALALALAAVALAAVLGGGGGGSGVTLRAAAALTLRPATAPGPAQSPRNAAYLAAAVQGVSFPYWQARLGWRSSGERIDTVAGRPVRTVFYSGPAGRRIGYAIVAGSPPALEGSASWRRGARFHVISENGVEVVSWLRSGHLCVVSGRHVAAATLLALAAWDGVPAAV